MGILDFFKRSDNQADRIGKKAGEVTSKEVARWERKARDKRAQNYDRQEALTQLAELAGPIASDKRAELEKTPEGRAELEHRETMRAEAAGALLRRFTITMDPSITDQEEKQIAEAGVLDAGACAIEPLRTFAATAESLSWPMRLIKSLLEPEAYVLELLTWLSKWDTEYAKFIDPKIQLLVELEEHKHPKIRETVRSFLLDVNEVARFHAVGATLAQDDPEAIATLIADTFLDEESVRVRTRVAEGFIARKWAIPEDQRAEARKSLPSGYTIDGEGHFTKR